MKIQQFVMAYGVEHDQLRALLPPGYTSLRPVLRINAELWEDGSACLELNTAVEREGIRGWLNIAHWEKVPHAASGKTAVFTPPGLTISFTGMGIQGGLPRGKGQCRVLLPRTGAGAPSGGGSDRAQGVLRLHLCLGKRKRRQEPGQDPPGHPHSGGAGLCSRPLHGGECRCHSLRPGAGGLYRDL